MGRFLSPDPIGTADDINLYRYVANSPVMYVDPNGTVKLFFIDYFDNVRKISSNVGLFVATPLLYVPATTPLAVGLITATNVLSVSAAGAQSYLTGDSQYIVTEGGSAVIGAAGGALLKKSGIISDVVWNSSAGRYMGHASDGSYGFIKNQVGHIGLATAQSAEQVIGWFGQKLLN